MRRLKTVWKVLFILMFITACTANMGNVPWYVGIKDWSPEQKANFFMKTWMAEKDTYDSQNAIEGKSPELIKTLKIKREVLEQSRLPIRSYVSVVASGSVPDTLMEQEIIKWLRQLQMQYTY